MIPIAKMRPGVSVKSGRRYFRGVDRNGNSIWMLQDLPPHEDRWTLSFTPPARAFGPLPDIGPQPGNTTAIGATIDMIPPPDRTSS